MRSLKLPAVWALMVIALGSCLHDSDRAQEPDLGPRIEIQFTHSVGSAPLAFNSLVFENLAGNTYSVTKLRYVVSDFKFYDTESALVFSSDSVVFVDASSPEKSNLTFTGVPLGNYGWMEFTFGVAPAKNTTSLALSSPDLTAFAWPEMMGGGVHFMQLEGNYTTSAQSEPKGYAVHLGSLNLLPQYNHFGVALDLPQPWELAEEGSLQLSLHMDVNQWFSNPHIYDLTSISGGIMGNDSLQQILKENGMSDVFTLNTSGEVEVSE